MFDNEAFSLNPVHFFALSCDCRYLTRKDQFPSLTSDALPSTHRLTNETSFAKVAMGWHEEGLAFHIRVNESAGQSCYPAIEQGDSIELLIDSRDLKSAGFNTRFCHHFFFCPKLSKESLAVKKLIFEQKIAILYAILNCFSVRFN